MGAYLKMKGDFTLLLSGVEPKENWEVASSVTKNVLLSYKYIRKRGLDEIVKRLKSHRGMKVLIDSGAYTFFNDKEFNNKTIEWWEDYLVKYINFIREYRDYIFACVELDIDSIVGEDIVEGWREKYFYPLEREGINVIYLYHLDKDLSHFEKLCKQHPYVGFSYMEIKHTIEDMGERENLISQLFQIAKRYKSAIHGFAITGNKLLLSYPFFSADSTTYLTGAQFGTITYFEAGQMKHLEKTQWKTEYMEKLKALGLKEKLLEIESPYELIRANAISYKKFEEYVKNVMRPQKYWEARSNTKYSIPDAAWFEGDMQDWQERLELAGIDTNIPQTAGETILHDAYIFLNEPKEAKNYELDDLVGLCAMFGATGANYNTKDKCIKFLQEAFKEHVDGMRNELSNLQSPQDGQRIALEREDYITEKEYLEVEMSREECGELLPALLTSGYDKDDVEKSLIEQGIKPIYDKNGNILKGIKKVKRQKKLSTRALPRLSCDRCVMAANCTEYQAGYICAYDKMFRRFNTREQEDVIQGMTAIADLAIERAQKAFMLETAMGGTPTKATSQAMQDAFGYLTKLKELQDEVKGRPVMVSQTKIKGGSIEQTVVHGANPQSGGILERIFMEDTDDEKTVEAEVVK